MKLLISSLLLMFAFSASAYTGDELLIDCGWYIEVSNDKGTTGSVGKSLSAGRCQGFITALIQSYNQYITRQHIQQNLFCLTANTNTNRLAKVLVNHLEQTAEIESKAAAELALDALGDAYPCTE